MNYMQSRKRDTAEFAGTRLAVAGALVLLLLASQLSAAANGSVPRFTFAAGCSQLEAEQPDTENPHPLLPDILHEPALQPRQNCRYGSVISAQFASDEAPASFADIRAPPRLS